MHGAGVVGASERAGTAVFADGARVGECCVCGLRLEGQFKRRVVRPGSFAGQTTMSSKLV
ncbi:hypothetical protein T440DRAFT_473615 [Plenodomus tracheiphilus IPT5]|uniref:Uncharacterized protein n=1 Tax=Plenodomus tracheiphilus IPT5 TaxID=1408161 RepID=A0A6A7APE5_9PLEO|nr:hypothetical protein T440DRAFT_473615 [Plenodomus tracheiphilus IPT5]